MADREKVVKGLECCTNGEVCISDCPYFKEVPMIDGRCITALQADALFLLKEQEPKQIIRKQGKRENSDGSIDYFAEWYCPHCGKLFNRGFDMPWIEYCYKCGKPVLWQRR